MRAMATPPDLPRQRRHPRHHHPPQQQQVASPFWAATAVAAAAARADIRPVANWYRESTSAGMRTAQTFRASTSPLFLHQACSAWYAMTHRQTYWLALYNSPLGERSAHGFGQNTAQKTKQQIFIYYCAGQVVSFIFLSSRVIYRDPLGTPGTRCRPLYVRSRAPRLAWSGFPGVPCTGALMTHTLPYP